MEEGRMKRVKEDDSWKKFWQLTLKQGGIYHVDFPMVVIPHKPPKKEKP
jgi:hypothetical protein